MRERVWKNLANIKFKASYCNRYAALADRCGRFYSFVLAFASAGSVAAWAFWKHYPGLWAAIVAVAQVLQVAKPYIPFLGRSMDYLSMSFDFEKLYLLYERLWYDMEDERIGSEAADKLFYEFREREMEIERLHKAYDCRDLKFLVRKALHDSNIALALNFNTGDAS